MPARRISSRSGDLLWTLSITFAGRTFRWSSEPFDVTDAAGNLLVFDGGLSPIEIEDAFAGVDQAPDDVSVPIEVLFPVDVSLLVAQGHALAGSVAEIALYPRDGAWEDRRVVIDGIVVEPYYGADDEPVGFSVELRPNDDQSVVPPASAIVDDTKFLPFSAGLKNYAFNGDDQSEVIGLSYPLVFGTPGWYSRAPTSYTTSGSPGIIVYWSQSGVTSQPENNYLLIAGHHVGATDVIVFWDNSSTSSIAVINTTDDVGRKVALVHLGDDTAANTIGDAEEYWIGWNSTPGGLQNPHADGPLELAGDVCEYFLSLSTLQVDRGAWAAARPYLNRFRLAGYIDEPVGAWEWLADNVLPLLPVDVRSGPRGLYPVVWRLDAKATDCVGEPLVEGQNVSRLGQVEYGSMDNILNDITIRYSKRARTGHYKSKVQINGKPAADSDERQNLFARLSEQRYGRKSKSITTDVVYDDQTASLIVQWMLAAYAFPPRKIKYQATADFADVAPGDPVLLTDADLHITEQVALVQSVTWNTEDDIELELWLFENPPRDSRPTA